MCIYIYDVFCLAFCGHLDVSDGASGDFPIGLPRLEMPKKQAPFALHNGCHKRPLQKT